VTKSLVAISRLCSWFGSNGLFFISFLSALGRYGCFRSFIVKKKSKAVPLHAMEADRGRGGIAPTHT
jgi:hypothetical protein